MMTRRKLVAGNWKMNGNQATLAELDDIAIAVDGAVDVALCVPFTLIAPAVVRAAGIAIGAQDCHWARDGAHTGCVSVAMLAEVGAQLVIVGHSERRTDQHETDAEVRAKAEAAIAGGLIAIVCVGETEAQRDAGETLEIVGSQLGGSVPPDATAANLVVAYEPVWAIGTGRTPSIDDVHGVHGFIRDQLKDLLPGQGGEVRILYGGSVKPDNAVALMAIDDVDGALVGGASLTARQFVPIIRAAG
jgi:triosephosphate isomerase